LVAVAVVLAPLEEMLPAMAAAVVADLETLALPVALVETDRLESSSLRSLSNHEAMGLHRN